MELLNISVMGSFEYIKESLINNDGINIIGQAGSGKTNMVVELITDFVGKQKVILISEEIDQINQRNIMVREAMREVGVIEYYTLDKLEYLVNESELGRGDIVIFDIPFEYYQDDLQQIEELLEPKQMKLVITNQTNKEGF